MTRRKSRALHITGLLLLLSYLEDGQQRMIQAIEVSEEQRSCEDRSREGFKILAHWGAVSMYVRMQMSAGGGKEARLQSTTWL